VEFKSDLNPWWYGLLEMTLPRVISTDALAFGDIVTRLRLQRGFTKAKLAQRAGISAQYMALVEQGLNVASLTTVLDLLEVLGADGGEVFRELLARRNTAQV
jgi:transcriptional regulator with XRE-family HTH domain